MRSSWRKEAQGIGCPHQGWQGDLPRAGEGETQARSPGAVKARLSRTTRVRVFSLSAFPPGITVEGATPKRGGLTVNCGVKRPTLPDGAPASKKPGSLPPLSPLSCGAPPRRARGDARGAASLRLVASDTGNPCCPVSDAVFGESHQPRRRGLRPLRERRCGCGNHETAG